MRLGWIAAHAPILDPIMYPHPLDGMARAYVSCACCVCVSVVLLVDLVHTVVHVLVPDARLSVTDHDRSSGLVVCRHCDEPSPAVESMRVCATTLAHTLGSGGFSPGNVVVTVLAVLHGVICLVCQRAATSSIADSPCGCVVLWIDLSQLRKPIATLVSAVVRDAMRAQSM